MPIRTKNKSRSHMPKSFGGLVALMPPMAIRDDIQHENMIEMIDQLMQIRRLSRGQTDYLETLVELAEVYEDRQHAIGISNISGSQTLRHILDQSGTSASELGRLLEVHPTMGSKILNGSRKLTWEHAKVLGRRFNLKPELFMD